MPRAGRVCSVPGCPEITPGGRCPDHRRAAEQARGTFRDRGYRAGHDLFRAQVLARDPVCVECRAAPAVVADHHPDSRRALVATGLDPDDPGRGRGLCVPCHGRATQARPDERGGWNARPV